MFELTPQLLEMALQRFGIAAGQLKNIDSECKKALVSFVFQAVQSGDANSFIKERLRWLESYVPASDVPPPAARVSTRPVDPAPSSSTSGPRPRRR